MIKATQDRAQGHSVTELPGEGNFEHVAQQRLAQAQRLAMVTLNWQTIVTLARCGNGWRYCTGS